MMIRSTLIILWFGLMTSKFSYGQLNKQIDRSQKVAILNSPFKAAKGLATELARQRKIRHKYLTIIDSLRTEFPNDTILLIENYDFICFGCQSYLIQIQIGTDLVSLSKNLGSKNYERKTEKLTDLFINESGAQYVDIQELIFEINKNQNWNKNPEKFGTEDCFDGGHTFYTVLYPDRKILSMYMRCWINKEMRKSKE